LRELSTKSRADKILVVRGRRFEGVQKRFSLDSCIFPTLSHTEPNSHLILVVHGVETAASREWKDSALPTFNVPAGMDGNVKKSDESR
jgi:hypothetical protein